MTPLKTYINKMKANAKHTYFTDSTMHPWVDRDDVFNILNALEIACDALEKVSEDKHYVTSDSTSIKYDLGKTDIGMAAEKALSQITKIVGGE